MNDVINALMERRSIRKYKSEPINDKELETIITCCLYAPSARNTQGWHITAIADPAKIEDLNQAVKTAVTKEGFDQYKDLVSQGGYSINFKTAPVFIIVSVDLKVSLSPQEDGALVLGNIMLAAHSLGFGSCWINQLKFISEESGFRQKLSGLGVPSGNKVIGCAALGRPAVDHPKAPARKTGLFNIVR